MFSAEQGQNILKTTQQGASGTKYRGSRTGIVNSLLDRNIGPGAVVKRIHEKYGGLYDNNGNLQEGTAGIVRFAAVDRNGNPLINRKDKDGKIIPDEESTINIGGRTFRSVGGMFTIVDEEYLNENLEMQKEIDEYVNKITDYCGAGDQTTADLLGVSGGDLLKILDTNNADVSVIKNATVQANLQKKFDLLPDSVKNACGLPSLLNVLDKNSSAFSTGLSKLKAVVSVLMPIVENTSKSFKESKLDTTEI